MGKELTYIFRTPSPAFHSIEEVFGIVIPEVGKQLPVKKIELPYPSGFWGVLKNLTTFRKEKNTLYHITGQEYYMALRTGRNTVLTIHDTGSAFSGKWLRDLLIRIFWFWLPALIARKITVISEFSKGELVRLVPFAASKIRVIHNPVPPQIRYTPREFNAGCPVILVVGTKPNKNLPRIISALEGIPCHLVIIGKRDPSLDEQLSLLGFVNHKSRNTNHGSQINSSELRAQGSGESEKSAIRNPQSAIRNTFSNFHNLPYKEILAQYQNCDLLCFASTYEGFGVPILEAQATGRPVITSLVASMPEVAGDGACLVDPFSVESIREGVQRVIQDSAYREALVRNGLLNTERFSPEKIAADYLMVYGEMITDGHFDDC